MAQLNAVMPSPAMCDLRSRSWIVAQIGARQHYTVPLGFERLGKLHSFYTTLWCRFGSQWLERCGGRGAHLAGRYCAELPPRKVFDSTFRTLWSTLSESRRETIEQRFSRYIRTGQQFALSVNRRLLPRLNGKTPLAYFAFNTGALETLEVLKERKVPTVVDQIDPARVEERIVWDEINRWPGWQPSPARTPDPYFKRLQAEWELADVVLVNSAWCRDALIEQGVPSGKIAVAPIAYAAPDVGSVRPCSPRRSGPLRLLWLGQVNLRKGVQYLMEAARLLLDCDVEFRVIGPIGISREAVASAPSNLRFEGPLPRIETGTAYRWADVFVLPTLSDGFAVTQLEAMAHGLPVVATPNCGDVVSHERDGLIVPIRDPHALARGIGRLADDRPLLAEMSANALTKVRSFEVTPIAWQRLTAIAEVFENASIAI
jgi:glycosyltransferase involved in cell wall biosynthesis